MGIEARYDSQIRYLTKRATQSRVEPKRGRKVWIAHKGNLTDLHLFHLVNRLLFQLYWYFKEIIVSQYEIALKNLVGEESVPGERLHIYVVWCKGVVLPLQMHVRNGAY